MSFNFGNTAVAAPAASSGFNFGTTTSAPAAAPATNTGGFSFGSAAPAAAAPAGSAGFSFNAAPAATATAAPAASGGFSFGGANTGTASAAPASGFSFGATPAAAAAPASSGGFGFGATTPAATTASTGLFGSTNTASTGLFGGGAASTGGSSFFNTAGAKPAGTTSLFGGGATTGFTGFNGAQPQQALAPAQPAITLETVFDALPGDVKKNITDFHQFLREEDQSDAFLKSVSARKQDDLKANLEQLEQDVLVRRNLQDRQATAVHHIRKDVKHLINQVDNATLNLRSMSGESTSQRFYGIMRRVEVPSPYYWELLDSFEGRMEQIKTLIENVESEYRLLYESQRTSVVKDMDPAMLHQIMLAQNTAMIQLAAHVAEVHEKTEEMRQAFVRKMKQDMLRHGETNLARFKNPFDKRKKASHDSDIDNIRFKTSVTPTIVQQPQPQPQAATGFGGWGTTATTTPGFGTTTPGFGTTGAAATGGSSLFAAKPTISTAPAATGGFGGFGSTTLGATSTAAAPKQVSFSLGGSAAPTISTSTAPVASTGFSFGGAATPAAATGSAFGAAPSAFLPPTATPALGAGDKRTASNSGGLRNRQKKR